MTVQKDIVKGVKGGVKGVKKPTYKNEANIEIFINMLTLGTSVIEICDAIGFKRQTYYQWLEDMTIMKEVDKRIHKIHTEGQAFIKARYKKYLTNIDKLCEDTTDKRTCLSANQYMIDRMDGKSTSTNIIVPVNETADSIDSAKDLLKKYNKQLVDTIEDTTEDTIEKMKKVIIE